MPSKKKLIEVSLPLDAINKAAAREKSIRHGHPSTLHLWWARRPLAAARAVIFAQMVDDPSTYIDVLRGDAKLKRKALARLKARHKTWDEARQLYEETQGSNLKVPEPGPEPTLDEALADLERERLFAIIEELVKWENTTNETVLQQARDEIWQSWRRACAENADHPQARELFDRHKLPAFHDPFAGGGALPLEAQRLGLESYASDLNPVAVLINKAMIEIPPRFAGQPPVNPRSRADVNSGGTWRGATGLAEDVRYYGQWMRDEAEKRIGHLYPKVEINAEMVAERPDLAPYLGQKLTVIAWLWARTVKSPNPAFANVDVPLASTFMLSTKKGKEAYVEPVIEGGGYRFTVKVGQPRNAEVAKNGTKLTRGANFKCLMSDSPMTGDYIKDEGKAGRMGTRLMAIVADGTRGRVYLPPSADHEALAKKANPEWRPETPLPESALGFSVQLYFPQGTYSDLFTGRQLLALTTLSDIAKDVRAKIAEDVKGIGSIGDSKSFAAYADAISLYLALAIDKAADYDSALVMWSPTRDQVKTTFARNAMPMIWDFAEVNVFAKAAGDPAVSLEGIARIVSQFGYSSEGIAIQSDAQSQSISNGKVISTDPPYFDNIGYADLSDFFYSWLRATLRNSFPELLATVGVPKAEELVATPARHGGRRGAQEFFLAGMQLAMHRLAAQTHPAFPITIYYAFKQTESDDDKGTSSTGWEAFLDAVQRAGLSITGTWPIRTERDVRSRGIDSNALASSILLVCRPRSASAQSATRREFLNSLKSELPAALAQLQAANIAPVDLAQAAIGPGMAVYTRYDRVLDAEGKPLLVRTALALINQVLDEALAEQEGDFDADSRFALAWFEQHGFTEGEFGVADVLARAKGTAVDGVAIAGIIVTGKGKVRILKPNELPVDWDPMTDKRLTVWEMVHQLIRVLESAGESAAAELAVKLGSRAETARELCYRLYTVCERKKRPADAMAYNALVQSWPEISRLAQEAATRIPQQSEFALEM